MFVVSCLTQVIQFQQNWLHGFYKQSPCFVAVVWISEPSHRTATVSFFIDRRKFRSFPCLLVPLFNRCVELSLKMVLDRLCHRLSSCHQLLSPLSMELMPLTWFHHRKGYLPVELAVYFVSLFDAIVRLFSKEEIDTLLWYAASSWHWNNSKEERWLNQNWSPYSSGLIVCCAILPAICLYVKINRHV